MINHTIGAADLVDGDCTTAFPKTHKFLQKDIERMRDPSVENKFNDNIMSNATEKSLDQALIYVRDEFMKDGLSMVLITDLMLATYVARALILVLHLVLCITLNAQELQQCQSAYTSILPVTSLLLCCSNNRLALSILKLMQMNPTAPTRLL